MNNKKKSIKGLQFLGICGFFSSSNEEAEERGPFIVTKEGINDSSLNSQQKGSLKQNLLHSPKSSWCEASEEAMTACESASEDLGEVDGDIMDAIHEIETSTDFFLPKGPLQIYSLQIQMDPIGLVKAGSFRSKYRVAIKTIQNQKRTTKLKKISVEKELKVLKYLGNYPTILSCYGYVINGPSLQIVYELAPYGSLDKVLRENKVQSFPLALMVAWMSDLADAMQFLHSKGIIHGDIKAENILVFERLETKLCNFHTAKSASELEMDIDKCFRSTSFLGEKAQKTLPSFSRDLTAFFHTSLQVFTRSSSTDLQAYLNGQDLDKALAQAMINFPLSVYNISSSVYSILTSLLLAEKNNDLITSKEISEQLFHVLEETCDGDPRDYSSPFGMLIKQIEKILISSTDQIQQIVQLTNLIDAGGSSEIMRINENTLALQLILQRLKESNGETAEKVEIKGKKSRGDISSDNSIQSRIPETEMILDQRQILREWLETVCAAPSGIAENIACSFIQSKIYSIDILQERVRSNPSFLKKIHMGDRALRRRIYETLRSTPN
eukprot:gene7063-7625_t